MRLVACGTIRYRVFFLWGHAYVRIFRSRALQLW